MAILFTITLVFHIIGVIIAVGSATIVDYLHIISLRKSRLEKGLVKIYPYISRMINAALGLIYLSGILLVLQKPELLSSTLFQIKIALVILVTLNGIYLQKRVSPELDKCIIKGNKYCTSGVLYSSAIAGSISIVTWYSLLVLSMTKNLGYTPKTFLISYTLVLIGAMTTAYLIERKARKWRK